MKKRTFTIIDYPKLGETSGRYVSTSPHRAAYKVLTHLSKKADVSNETKKLLMFTIKETTRGSKNNEYTYKGTRVKLETPTVVNNISFNYKNILYRVK